MMPIYEFKCAGCGEGFEKIVKVDETPGCPNCGSSEVERVVSFSATVSTSRSRSRSVAGARARTSELKKEQDRAHEEYRRKHIEDHH